MVNILAAERDIVLDFSASLECIVGVHVPHLPPSQKREGERPHFGDVPLPWGGGWAGGSYYGRPTTSSSFWLFDSIGPKNGRMKHE